MALFPPPRIGLFDHRYRSNGTINTSSWRIDTRLLGRRRGRSGVVGSVHRVLRSALVPGQRVPPDGAVSMESADEPS